MTMSSFYKFKKTSRNSKKYTILHFQMPEAVFIKGPLDSVIYLKPTKKTTFIVKGLDSEDSFIFPLKIDKKESKFSLIRMVLHFGFTVVGFFVIENTLGYSKKADAMPVSTATWADGSTSRGQSNTNQDGSLVSGNGNSVVSEYLTNLYARRSKSKLSYARRFTTFIKSTHCLSSNETRAVIKEISDPFPRRSTNSTAVSGESQSPVVTNCRLLDGKVVSATEFDIKVAKLTSESEKLKKTKKNIRNPIDILFLDHSEVKLNERHNGRAIIRKTFKGLKNQNPAQNNLNSENDEHYGYFFSTGPDRYVYNRVSFNMNVSDVHSSKSLKASLEKLEKKQQTYKYDRFESDHLVQNDVWSLIYPGKLPRNGQNDSSKSLLCSSSTNSAFNRTQIGFSDALKNIFLTQGVEGEPCQTIFHSENKFSLTEIIHKICYDTIIARGNMIEVFIRDRAHQAWLDLVKDNKHKYTTEVDQIKNLKKPFL